LQGLLYLLVLQNKEAFKVGITNQRELDRIKNLNKIYNFDLKNSYILESEDEKTTQLLERQIHSDYKPYHYEILSKTDGHTEFIKIDQLENIIEDIRHKCRLKHLGLNLKQGVVLKLKPVKIKNEERKKIKKQHNDYSDFKNIDKVLNIIIQNKDKFKYKEILHYNDKNEATYLEPILVFNEDYRDGENFMRKIFYDRGFMIKSKHVENYGSLFSCVEFCNEINYFQARITPIYKKYKNSTMGGKYILDVNTKVNGKLKEFCSVLKREIKPFENLVN